MCIRLNTQITPDAGGAKNDQPYPTSGFGFRAERSFCQTVVRSGLPRFIPGLKQRGARRVWKSHKLATRLLMRSLRIRTDFHQIKNR
jgi:hypothetical protein